MTSSISKWSKLQRVLIDHHVWITLTVLCNTAFFQLLYRSQFDYRYLIPISIGTYLVYNLNRWSLFVSNLTGFKQSIVYTFLYLITGISFVIYPLLNFWNPSHIVYILFYLAAFLAGLYMLPNDFPVRIHHLSGIKPINLFISWFILIVVCTAKSIDDILSQRILVMHYALVLLSICIVFDNKDIVFDKKQNIRTLPVIWGFENTKKLCLGIASLSVLMAIIQLLIHPILGSFAFIMSMITYILIRNTQSYTQQNYYYFFVDGILFIYGFLGIIIIKYLMH